MGVRESVVEVENELRFEGNCPTHARHPAAKNNGNMRISVLFFLAAILGNLFDNRSLITIINC